MKILLLGGYGGVGRVLARLLLSETDCDLVIAGRREDKAAAFSASLHQKYSGNRVTLRHIDVRRRAPLRGSFSGVDLVIVAAAVPDQIEHVARAVLESGCDYLDILVQNTVWKTRQTLLEEIISSGRIFITQGGFHPGLPAPLIRYAASQFDQMDRASVSLAMNARFKKPESTVELIEEVRKFQAELFSRGEWRKATYKDSVSIDFGPPFGIRPCVPLQMEEIKTLPFELGLNEMGLYVSGFNWVVDYLIIPLIILTHRIKEGWGDRLMQRLLFWGVNLFSPSTQKVVMRLEGEGVVEGKRRIIVITLEHCDAYFFTAAPVVACIKQMMGGMISRPTLNLMGLAVDPVLLLHDLQHMGIQMKTSIGDR